MHYFLTNRIETKVGLLVIFTWAVIAGTAVLRSIANYGNFLAGLHNDTPIVKTVARAEHDRINRWLREQGLNTYGDAPDTVYPQESPLIDEASGKPIDRYSYLMRKFPGKPWRR